jgi:hypothetical protein
MSIEWGNTLLTSYLGHKVIDNSPAPSEVLRARQPFKIEVKWGVPAALASLISNGDTFRLRAYVESIGPGQEMQIGDTVIVQGNRDQLDYNAVIPVNPNPLLGEGDSFNGVAVSGVYNVICVLQHLNGGVPTVHSGVSDEQPMVMFKSP